jgi:hypothetical protein
MKSKMSARPVARKPQREAQPKKTVAPSRKSAPMIQGVDRSPSRQAPEIQKKTGELPVPVATFYF